MAKYCFRCPSCNVQFERVFTMGTAPKTVPCPSCRRSVERHMTFGGFGFKTSGDVNSPTGVHSLDYPTADMAVGRSADAGWRNYAARDEQKTQTRTESGVRTLQRVGLDNSIYKPLPDLSVRRTLMREVIEHERESAKTGTKPYICSVESTD